MNEQIYTLEELENLSDEHLLGIIFTSWGIDDEKIEILGELPPLGHLSYGFLQNPFLIKTGERLYYPIQGYEHMPCRFFISPIDASKCGSKDKRRFIRCTLEISPKAERIKHKNPLGLCVKNGTSKRVVSLPKEIPIEVIVDPNQINERSQFISKEIYDFYYDQAIDDLEQKIQIKRQELDSSFFEHEKEIKASLSENSELIKQSEVTLNTINNNIDAQKQEQNIITQNIKNLIHDTTNEQNKLQKLLKRYTQIENEMNCKIDRLKSYIADKAQFLKTFEFVDEEDLELFLLDSKSKMQPLEGISFSNELNGDYKKAVSYIQAFLVENNILYPRHVIENFITLLRTKDLIILAGDSGSGKTNLVKSFAKAVGGKYFIIPVKPNWTSSEDLLGYYNPLEKKYLATHFLEAIIDAQQNPEIPYFICLDEMNLARVEYYFADFLSLLETRDETPEIVLYAENESSHVLSELKAVVDIIQSAKAKYSQDGIINFIELLKDETLNSKLRLAFGFSDKDSLIKYHSEIRRMLSAVISMPARIKFPENLHIIGAINIDETTHYLSPKILDRAHIMRFESPLLSDWDAILEEVEKYEFQDVSKPLIFNIEALGYRKEYPKFDRNNAFCQLFIQLNKDFFQKLGVEFGMRTIRQGLYYLELFQDVNSDTDLAINNFLLHKVLPKFTFDGNKSVGERTKIELIETVLTKQIRDQLPDYQNYTEVFSAIHALENIVKDAKLNDGIMNFWS
ncbi:AAA family ATPase [Bartonella sp. HY761]|uniref:AAA family ATPase n=1 Tax=Bartonella sp. HY761 TaxID=2979330 RepID=UPI0022088A7A|nr:AAA family ATPase [Bartonella sp. HY761]UXN05413.1 AAA family ATPase [Bartonella sp. HY761]